MTIRITRYESTPNPNALKCVLSEPISTTPRSFLNSGMAEVDPLARRLFHEADLTTLLINGDWMTINKPDAARWPAVKRRVEQVLAEFDLHCSRRAER